MRPPIPDGSETTCFKLAIWDLSERVRCKCGERRPKFNYIVELIEAAANHSSLGSRENHLVTLLRVSLHHSPHSGPMDFFCELQRPWFSRQNNISQRHVPSLYPHHESVAIPLALRLRSRLTSFGILSRLSD